ncbi:MAG: hypothetical protein KAT28_05575 [Candidatus Aenigmarchaeota archaeon]|nr:hypothetical protein [Candidatus Aenigmarchaeota archaeon]
MKGDEGKSPVLITILVVILLFVMVASLGLFKNFASKEGTYEKMGNPLVWGGEELMEMVSGKYIKIYEEFLNEVQTVFVYDELERECANWFSTCTENNPVNPRNPWTKLDISEKDLELMVHLNCDCMTLGIKGLIKTWEKGSPEFKKRNDFEKCNLIKNACGSVLVERIYK